MQKYFYNQLDGLRAIAVISVMLSHWVFISQDRVLVDLAFFKFFQNLGLGFIGVNLFFVLSGFLISEILLKQKQEGAPYKTILKNFYIRRALRIFPIYYIVIIFAALFNFDNGRLLLPVNLTYTLNFYNSITGNLGDGLSHLWSLCVEEQFYIIWPLLLLLVSSKHHKKLIISTIIIAVLYRTLLMAFEIPNYHIHNYRMMPGCMDALGLGALLAYLKLNDITILKKILKIKLIPALALIAYLLSTLFNKDFWWLSEMGGRSFIGVISFYLIGNAVFNFKNWFGKFLENKFIQYLGKISYGLYLYHLIISNLLKDNFQNALDNLNTFPSLFKYNPYLISTPLYFILTVLISSASYYMIEKPFLKIKDKFQIKWVRNSNLPSSVADGLPNDMPSISRR